MSNFKCWEYFQCGHGELCLAFKFKYLTKTVHFCGRYCFYDKWSTCISPYGFTTTNAKENGLEGICKNCKRKNKEKGL